MRADPQAGSRSRRRFAWAASAAFAIAPLTSAFAELPPQWKEKVSPRQRAFPAGAQPWGYHATGWRAWDGGQFDANGAVVRVRTSYGPTDLLGPIPDDGGRGGFVDPRLLPTSPAGLPSPASSWPVSPSPVSPSPAAAPPVSASPLSASPTSPSRARPADWAADRGPVPAPTSSAARPPLRAPADPVVRATRPFDRPPAGFDPNDAGIEPASWPTEPARSSAAPAPVESGDERLARPRAAEDEEDVWPGRQRPSAAPLPRPTLPRPAARAVRPAGPAAGSPSPRDEVWPPPRSNFNE